MAKSDSPGRNGALHAAAGCSTGRLFIVCAPSGAGKSTLCGAMRREYDELTYSISYTTRPPRRGEREGRDYFFISVEEFERGIRRGRWAEWARVHGNYYGSSAQWIEDALTAGRHILMDIDIQGTRQMLQHFPRAVTFFIMPPSMEVLERRLRARGTESPQTIALRLDNAREEIAHKGLCTHILVNDDLNLATGQLSALFRRYLGGRDECDG
jgi:guanylate kinase